MSSILSTLIPIANSQEKWDIEYMLGALVISASCNGEYRVDSSNLGVKEAETLYKFLRGINFMDVNVEDWHLICDVANELVRFQGNPLSTLDDSEDSPLLTNIFQRERMTFNTHRRLFQRDAWAY